MLILISKMLEVKNKNNVLLQMITMEMEIMIKTLRNKLVKIGN